MCPLPLRELLLVDDEKALARMLEITLRGHGFVVRVAHDGPHAVQVYRQHRASIGVVLLDVHMPGMDGPQTLLTLREIRANVRVVFMSGNTGPSSEDELLALGASHVFEKPFKDMAQLIRVLRELLADDNGPALASKLLRDAVD
jgi:CheY-like chemotaxis protein